MFKVSVAIHARACCCCCHYRHRERALCFGRGLTRLAASNKDISTEVDQFLVPAAQVAKIIVARQPNPMVGCVLIGRTCTCNNTNHVGLRRSRSSAWSRRHDDSICHNAICHGHMVNCVRPSLFHRTRSIYEALLPFAWLYETYKRSREAAQHFATLSARTCKIANFFGWCYCRHYIPQ